MRTAILWVLSPLTPSLLIYPVFSTRATNVNTKSKFKPLNPQGITHTWARLCRQKPPFHTGPPPPRESDAQVLTGSHEQGGQHADQEGRREPGPDTDGHPAEAGCAGDERRAAGGVQTATWASKHPNRAKSPLFSDRKAFPPGTIWTPGQAAPTASNAPSSGDQPR